MKLTFLGTGTSHGLPYIGCECAVCTSPDAHNNRLRSSIVIEDGEGSTRLLVDTTPDLRQQLLREKITWLSAVLWTHTHNDHIIGLDDLRPLTDRNGYLDGYAEASTLEHLHKLFDYAFVQGRDHAGFPRLTGHAIAPRVAFEIAGFCVTPIPIWHGKSEIFAYRFECDGSTLVYATDCSAIPEESWALMEGADVFVVDALRYRPHPTHFSVEEALAASAKIKPKRTLFTHITHDLDHATAEVLLPHGIKLAYDGMQIEL
jgi:phosphoribosyl 1,2-cyclic phosphate phosphodiesterase